MLDRYGSLYNLPYHHQPVMVHHIPRFLAVERTRKKLSKIALLVLDGLACDQWLLLKRHLEASDAKWRFQETTAFAWVPTVTSVTRQTIFAGEAPLFFPDSLGTTAKEKAHWQRFWENEGLQRGSVELVTSLDSVNDPNLEQALGNPRLRWPGYGLPPGRHVLLAGDLKVFTDEGDRIVAHGGIALEEVLVPFVAIRRDES